MNTIFYNKPEIIFDPFIINEDLTFIHGKKLNDSVNDLKLSGNEEIHYLNEKSFESEILKFEKLKTNNGWIHFNNGTSFKISEGKILSIKLRLESLGKLIKYDSDFVRKKLGIPDRIGVDEITWVFDTVKEAEIYFYDNKKLEVYFDPNSKKINQIVIGDISS